MRSNRSISRYVAVVAAVAATFVSTAGAAHAQVKFCGKTWPADAKSLECRFAVDDNLIPLRSLTELEEVVLASGRAKDLRPLVHLPKLKRLAIQNYDLPAGALKVLVRNTQLEALDLTGTKLSSGKQVAFLIQLKELNVTNTGLKSLKLMGNMKNLEGLVLKGLKQLRGLNVLTKLAKLKKLDLGETEIKNLKFLKKIKDLEDLTLPDETKDLSIVKNMVKLRRLVLRRSGVRDISVLAKLVNLRDLILDFAPAVQDWTPLAELTKMQRLEVNGGEVGNLKWLLPMRDSLVILSLRNANIVGALPNIGQMGNLRFLSLASTATTDIGALAKLKKLELLDLSGTHVSNLKPLNNCKKLRKLDLSNTNVERGEVERIKRVHPRLQVRYSLFLQ